MTLELSVALWALALSIGIATRLWRPSGNLGRWLDRAYHLLFVGAVITAVVFSALFAIGRITRSNPMALSVVQEIDGSTVAIEVEAKGQSGSGSQSLFAELPQGWLYEEGTTRGDTIEEPMRQGKVLIWPGIRLRHPLLFNVATVSRLAPDSSQSLTLILRDDNGNQVAKADINLVGPSAVEAVSIEMDAQNETNPATVIPSAFTVAPNDVLVLRLIVRNSGPFRLTNLRLVVDLPPLALTGLDAGDGTQLASIEPGVTIAGQATERSRLKKSLTVRTAGPAQLEYVAGSTKIFEVKSKTSGAADDIVGPGVVIGELLPGEENALWVTFRATVAETPQLPTRHPVNLDFATQVRTERDPDYTNERTLGPDDRSVKFRIYVFPSETLENGRLEVVFIQEEDAVRASATLFSDTIPPVYSDALLHLPPGKKLKYQALSTRVFGFNDTIGSLIADINDINPLTCRGHRLNSVLGGRDEYKTWYVFSMDLVDDSVPDAYPAPKLDLDDEVANLTTTSAFTDHSVVASAGDVLGFRIWVHNGIVGSTANDLSLRAELSYGVDGAALAAVLGLGSGLELKKTVLASIPSGTALEYMPGTTKMYTSGNPSAGQDILDASGGRMPLIEGYYLGNLKECSDVFNDRWLTFQMRVVRQ